MTTNPNSELVITELMKDFSRKAFDAKIDISSIINKVGNYLVNLVLAAGNIVDEEKKIEMINDLSKLLNKWATPSPASLFLLEKYLESQPDDPVSEALNDYIAQMKEQNEILSGDK